MRRPGRRRTLIALPLILLVPRLAAAHFKLLSPASWRVQNVLGDPQKLGPCGDEGTAATTGEVTAFAPGDTVTITLDETIFHPGHYRVALAVNDRSELPPEPPVTPGATPCGSVPIETSPVFPVLVDGALEHTEPFTGTRFIQVTLPSDVTCTRCTLQVLEFMSNHGVPCFYHHCADIQISAVPSACTSDADCADDNGCTADRCTAGACEHVDIAASCDDGNVCTHDACSATIGCVTQPITLADVGAGFLGDLPVPPCASDEVPRPIASLLGKAGSFVVRAAATPAKADRLLRRAGKRIRRARAKVAKAEARGAATTCTLALSAVLGEAQARLGCLAAP
ncbi:MAG TPA: SCE4755 family polysaccharide monooxygenase-like protein [Candidatus Binatia bacterium]|nr:SCE4755 family polysaccharide monooxygenase-like protein [Candidatus Binatia bacterium]